MRRPHVYERSAPRRIRDPYREPAASPVDIAREIAEQLEGSIYRAGSAGHATLAYLLEQARAEAEKAAVGN